MASRLWNKWFGISVSGVVAAVVSGMFFSPYTAPTKNSACRHELHSIRGILLAGDREMGVDFMAWKVDRQNTPPRSMIALVSEYCRQFSEKSHKSIFNFEADGLLLDPWKNVYNVGYVKDLQMTESDFKRISRCAIGNIILWSSGANGVNEHGQGDDVFEVPRTRK